MRGSCTQLKANDFVCKKKIKDRPRNDYIRTYPCFQHSSPREVALPGSLELALAKQKDRLLFDLQENIFGCIPYAYQGKQIDFKGVLTPIFGVNIITQFAAFTQQNTPG